MFANVEGVFAVVLGTGIAIGHHHLRHRRAIEDGAQASLVFVAHLVQHQPFAGVEANAQIPLLPADVVSVDLEAGSIGLGDVQGFDVLAQCGLELGLVLARVGGHGHNPQVFDANHRHFVEIYHGDQPVDGAGVEVAVGGGTQVADAAGEADAHFILKAKVARCPGIDHHQIQVADAALFQGSDEVGVLLDHRFAVRQLICHDVGLHTGDMLPTRDFALGQGDDRLIGLPGRIVEQDQGGFALEAITRLVAQHKSFGGFF